MEQETRIYEEHLTEEMIKRVTRRFLKSYYRFRKRPLENQTQTYLDLRTETGIIADVAYAIAPDDQSAFWATAEATSKDTREEVSFSVQKKLLWWDGVATATLLTAFFLGWAYSAGLWSVFTWGWPVSILSISAAVVVLTGLFYLSFFRLQRYRYIYAIEQFKRYHVDEQWIAVGEDVFEGMDDIYLEELKHQCVANGFGLITVDRKLEAFPLITPAREELFARKRSMVRFFQEKEWLQRIERLAKTPDWVRRYGRKFTSITRFKRKLNYHQILLTATGLLLMGGVFYKNLQHPPVIYQENKGVSEAPRENSPEPGFFITDSLELPQVNPKAEAYIPEETLQQGEVLNEKGGFGGISDFQYDCSRLYNLPTTIYCIQEGLYQNAAAAASRCEALQKSGIEAAFCWMGCFDGNDQRYLVWVDLLFDNQQDAVQQAKVFQKKTAFKGKKLAVKTLRSDKK